MLVLGPAGALCRAQIDPIARNLLELGYDQPLAGHGPAAAYAYYYYSAPDYFSPNVALRVALAPAYLDAEIGFKQLISPTTDVGLGVSGGAFGDNFYDVVRGNYLETQSFYGNGGGASLSLYQLLDPGKPIPLNFIAREGVHYSSYFRTPQTLSDFQLPGDQLRADTLVGLRLAGNQPVLYPALGLEVSVWFEQQQHFDAETYGLDDNSRITPRTELYWARAGLNYEFKDSGNKLSFAVTVAGSTDADAFSAWRLGGVLPLASEFPLVIPGYYYEELTATRLDHFYASDSIALDRNQLWGLRFEAATARVDYLTGYEQPGRWQTGAGAGLSFAPKKNNFKIVLRYGYGFDAIRHGEKGGRSLGLLFQYDFKPHKEAK